MVELPSEVLAADGRNEEWARWRAGLPRLVRDVLAEWSLTVDGRLRYGQTALAVPVRTRQGEAAVAKFGWPHPEARHEHLVLRAWGGDGAVRLLQADPRRSVLLLEQADADRDLTTVPVLEACEIVAGLYGRLHRPAIPQLDRLSTHAARWSGELDALRTDRLVPRRYVEQAAALARDFASDPDTDGTLLHGDLHYQNVLASDREAWLAIDPKPLSGDPAYEVASMLWNRWDEVAAATSVRTALQSRMFALVDVAALDEDRVRSWVVVRELVNVKWGLTSGAGWSGASADWLTQAVTIVKAVQP